VFVAKCVFVCGVFVCCFRARASHFGESPTPLSLVCSLCVGGGGGGGVVVCGCVVCVVCVLVSGLLMFVYGGCLCVFFVMSCVCVGGGCLLLFYKC